MGAGLLQTRWYSVGAPWGQFCPQGTLAVSGDIFGCPTVGWRMLAAARGWMLVNTLECPGRPLREERTGPKCPQCLAPRLRTQPARCAALCWQDPSAGDQHPPRADGREAGRTAKCTPLAPCTLSRSLPRQVWTSPPAWAEAQSSEDGNTPPRDVSGPPAPPGLLQSLGPPDPQPGQWRRAPLRPGRGDRLLQEQCLRAPSRGAAGAGAAPPR